MVAEEPRRWVTVDGLGTADDVEARMRGALAARGMMVGHADP